MSWKKVKIKTLLNRLNISCQPDDPSALLLGQWVFISMFVDGAENKHFGFRYYVDQMSNSDIVIFQTVSVGTSYPLALSAVVYWGGHNYNYNHCACWMQYVRIHLDWVADTEAKMLSLSKFSTDDSGRYLLKSTKKFIVLD